MLRNYAGSASFMILALSIPWTLGCDNAYNQNAANQDKAPNPNEALTHGINFLLQKQMEDGSWRSEYYATFRDGTALTPLVLLALEYAYGKQNEHPDLERAIKRGFGFLAQYVSDHGSVLEPKDGFDYPVYTAALAIRVLSHPLAQGRERERAAWVRYLKDRQLTDKLGWKPADKAYGGWGYCRIIPRKPEPDKFSPPLLESNLSATVFALDALASARELDATTRQAAAIFVRRCQNDDGGFHFIYDDPVRNKGGVATWKPLRFHSYGSTTADGLRALVLCNCPEDRDRIAQAATWLTKHFNAKTHPGQYAPAHEVNRNAVYYYYVASLAQTWALSPELFPDLEAKRKHLVVGLAERQGHDGSWTNPLSLVREDEPLVATSFAVIAISQCLSERTTR
ncbi:MAG: terpene cyclase/mutase family protein [Gemmatales bacterium]|nr:terpene cyclase/mutase family protein [Gemmatales bacterium]MDW7994920.1 terpene cyclase/mutase family protein [Gemmatales bacterium]